MVYKVPLGKCFLWALLYSMPIIIPPMLHTHLQAPSRAPFRMQFKGIQFYPTPKTSPCLFGNKINVGIKFGQMLWIKVFKTNSLCASNIYIKFTQFCDCFQLTLCTFLDSNLIFAPVFVYTMWSHTFHEQLYVTYSFFTVLGVLF